MPMRIWFFLALKRDDVIDFIFYQPYHFERKHLGRTENYEDI